MAVIFMRIFLFRLRQSGKYLKTFRPKAWILVPWIFTFLFISCSHKTSTTTLPFSTPGAFSDSGVQKMPEKWWLVFNDEKLNTFVDSALQSSFNLKIAWNRLQAAQAIVDRESSGLWPSLDGNLGTELTGDQTNQGGNLNFNMGLSSAYEIDLWGRVGAAVEAERYRAEATRFDYQIAALTLTAEITRTWFQLSEALSQLRLIQKQVETNQKLLEGIRNRLGIGQIRNVDIVRQQQLLEATKEQQIMAESRIELLKHKLAILAGNPPKTPLGENTSTLPEITELPETGIPAELVQRRPDIQSTYHNLKAADMDLASAISNQYPRFTISASLSSSSTDVSDLLQNWLYSIAGNLVTPIFYGGELKAEVKRNESVKQVRFYEYVQSVLTAYKEVEDALTQEEKQKQRIKSIKKQVKLAQQAYTQLQWSYYNGMIDYLDVLTALDEEQQLQRELLSEKLRLLEYRISLYRSLAGSFEIAIQEN